MIDILLDIGMCLVLLAVGASIAWLTLFAY